MVLYECNVHLYRVLYYDVGWTLTCRTPALCIVNTGVIVDIRCLTPALRFGTHTMCCRTRPASAIFTVCLMRNNQWRAVDLPIIDHFDESATVHSRMERFLTSKGLFFRSIRLLYNKCWSSMLYPHCAVCIHYTSDNHENENFYLFIYNLFIIELVQHVQKQT